MTELGRFYIEELETRDIKEIVLYDSKYVSIEDVTVFGVIKKFVKFIKFLIFKRNKLSKANIYEAIKVNAENVFEDQNEYLTEKGFPPINYREAFDYNKKEEKQNYIM